MPMHRFKRLARAALVAAAMATASAQPAVAECVGTNLIDALPESERAALVAASDAVPFPRGNLWQATRTGQVVFLVGTYHLDDPRHAGLMAQIAPLLAEAATVLVEAGPEEEAALKRHLARDPSVMVITTGPTLPEMLPEAEWQALVDAMRAREVPPFMAAKFQPWYVSMLLSMPTCGLQDATDGRGLDGMVIDAALAKGLPVRALEPYDTLFSVFGDLSQQEQLAMIRSTLALEPQAADNSVTLADSYFAGEGRLVWEFSRLMARQVPGYSPAQIEADFARMEDAMMTRRNRAWIPVIEDAARSGPVLAAFGALHLSGETGVLELLRQTGFAITRLDG